MQTLIQDLRFGARMLLKKPAFTFIAVLTLALGIGSCTAIYSVVNAVLLQSFPHIETDRWVYIWERPTVEGLSQVSVSIPNYRDWKNQNHSFSDVVLWMPWGYNLSGSGIGEPERVSASVVTTNLFSALNLVPAAGRMLNDADGKSSERPIVISYQLWQRRFGGDPNLPGQKINLNLVPHTVVGVAPPQFSFPPENRVDVWSVYQQSAIDSDTYRDARGFRVAAKLKPGVTLENAQAEMNVITARMAEQYPEDKGYGAMLIGMRQGVAGDFRTPLMALLGALGFVLLLACVNIANLQLVRLEARRKELAMRTALGAGRLRLMKQLLIESSLFVALAGVLGIWLAPEGVKLLLWLVPSEEIPWLQVKTSTSVLMVSMGLTFVTAMLAGLLPALRASRIDLTKILNGGTASSGTVNRRLRNLFVVAQIALAVIPLTGAGLLMNSLLRLQGVNPGFQSDHRLTFSYSAPRARYKDAAAIAQLAERIREEVQNTAGVKAAGLVQYLPFSPAVGWLQAISRQDPKGNPADLPHVRYTVATSGYFEAMNIPLKLGRTFSKADTPQSAPVVVINESMARRYFPNEDPIGKPLWIGHAQALAGSAPKTIVGVVGDTLRDQLNTAPENSAWVPVSQQNVGEDVWRSLFLVAHTESDPIGSFAAIRQRIATVDSELALTNIVTMDSRIGDSVWRQRFTANVLSAFSLVALAIATLGVFGITSYLVSQRTQEIGVRMALGALPGDIFRLVMKEGAVSVLLGIVTGLIGSYYLTRFLTGLLYGVQPTDPITFVSVAALLALVASLACSLSARKATKVDPIIALKSE